MPTCAYLPRPVQRGTVAGPADQARCLRGHLPHTSGAERADCSSPGEALVADLRAALCALGGRYAGAQRWPLKAVKASQGPGLLLPGWRASTHRHRGGQPAARLAL